MASIVKGKTKGLDLVCAAFVKVEKTNQLYCFGWDFVASVLLYTVHFE